MKISNLLIYWYLQNKRNLPWRETQNPYKIWLSEVILQQTRVNQGISYYNNFINKYPTVSDLANAKEKDILKLWQGLGYYSRARNLHFSAKYILNELNGVFPSNYSDLLALKGVGDYTASAIASICFKENKAVVDGNVYRVLSRYFNIDTPINSSKGAKEFKELAQLLIDESQPGNHNQAIMELGAVICKPQNPLCEECPLKESCLALKMKRIKNLPFKTKKAKIKKRYFNYLVVITNNKKTVLVKRTHNGIWKNLYEFPLIETKEEIDLKDLIDNNEFLNFTQDLVFNLQNYNQKSITHKLTHQHLITKFWILKTSENNNFTTKWDEIETFPVPKLIDNFIKGFILD